MVTVCASCGCDVPPTPASWPYCTECDSAVAAVFRQGVDWFYVTNDTADVVGPFRSEEDAVCEAAEDYFVDVDRFDSEEAARRALVEN